MAFVPASNAGKLASFRVLVVSDVLLYRDGVASGLAQMDRLSIVGASNGPDALDALPDLAVDAILLDASATESLAIARQLRAICPDIPIVGFGIGSEANSVACAEAGLIGFVGRDGTFAQLEVAVQKAIAGEVECSPQFAALLCQRVAALAGTVTQPPTTLTRRERQIAALVAEGLSNKEIAIELSIGPATVKNHIHNILEKLQVPRRGAIGSRFDSRRTLPAFRLNPVESEAPRPSSPYPDTLGAYCEIPSA